MSYKTELIILLLCWYLMAFSKTSLTNFGLGNSMSICVQAAQSSQLHRNWKLLKWYENQHVNLKCKLS